MREWVDRVVPGEEPLDARCPDMDRIINDATEIGRMTIECVVEPLREILADLPRVISIEIEHRGPARARADGWDV